MSSTGREVRQPSLFESLVPILVLAVLLAVGVVLFDDTATYGPIQVALLVSALVGAAIATRLGHRWPELAQAITEGIGLSIDAIFILLAVGALIGTWALSGLVPAMAYYGLAILTPSWFLIAAALLAAVVAFSIGSTWTTAGTIGVGLIGIAELLHVSLPATAGAAISGAYFGSKLSPLSDTTILASAVAGADLYKHIRHMLWTTVPAFVITLVVFAVISFNAKPEGVVDVAAARAVLASIYRINVITLLPLFLLIGLAMRKVAPFPAIMISAITAGCIGAFQQPAVFAKFVNDPALPPFVIGLKGVWAAMATGFKSNTGIAALDRLVSIGGMSSMLDTIWLIMSAMAFGAVLDHSGMLAVLNGALLRAATTTGRLIAAVAFTAFGMNIITGDQYLAILIPGKMYAREFKERELDATDLSRALDNGGTTTSVLVPWNSCGAFHAAALGVPVLAYAPFAIFTYLTPLVLVVLGFTGIGIRKARTVTGARLSQKS